MRSGGVGRGSGSRLGFGFGAPGGDGREPQDDSVLRERDEGRKGTG